MNSKVAPDQTEADEPVIPPFWQRLPLFLVYPFKGGPLITLIFVTIVLAVCAGIPLFFGGKLRVLVYLGFMTYCFNIMESVSRGQFDPELISMSFGSNGDRRSFKQTAVLVLFFILIKGLAFAVYKPVQQEPFQFAQTGKLGEMNAWPATPMPPGMTGANPAPNDSKANDEDDEDSSSASPNAGTPTANQAHPVNRMDQLAEGPDVSGPLGWLNAPIPGWLFFLAVILSLVLPTAMMVIVVNDNFLEALNPMIALHFIKSMGRGYFILWALTGTVSGLSFGLDYALEHMHGSILVGMLGTLAGKLISSYSTLVIYVMMGYAIYQYHRELGTHVEVGFDKQAKNNPGLMGISASTKPVDPFQQELDELVKAGMVKKAIDKVLDELRYDKLDIAMNQHLLRLYLMGDDAALIVKQRKQYLKALLKAGRTTEALVVYRDMFNVPVGPNAGTNTSTPATADAYEPEPEQLLPLAREAYKQRDAKLAAQLIKGFDKRYPAHADIPHVYLLAAQLTSEYARQDMQAMHILKQLIHRYPDGEAANEAKRYLTVLEKSNAAVG